MCQTREPNALTSGGLDLSQKSKSRLQYMSWSSVFGPLLAAVLPSLAFLGSDLSEQVLSTPRHGSTYMPLGSHLWLFKCECVKATQNYKFSPAINNSSSSHAQQTPCYTGHLRTELSDLTVWKGWGGDRGPLRVSHCLALIPTDSSLQVQLDTLPGMSLVAGKALSSARMADAVLSQSSLMGSQQFQDEEDDGKALPMDAPGQSSVGIGHWVRCYTQCRSPSIPRGVHMLGALASVSTRTSQSKFSARTGHTFINSFLLASP